jgi:hypothetical protein
MKKPVLACLTKTDLSYNFKGFSLQKREKKNKGRQSTKVYYHFFPNGNLAYGNLHETEKEKDNSRSC